jgi:hypothetical protein
VGKGRFSVCLFLRAPQYILPKDATVSPDVFFCVTTPNPLKLSLDDKTSEIRRMESCRRPGLFILVGWPAVSCLTWGYRVRTVFLSALGGDR